MDWKAAANRGVLVSAAVLLLLAVAAFVVAYSTLRTSLPQLDGRISFSDLSAPVTIERDALGTPTLRAQSRNDLAFATGFVHAQDRFFQMDLQRRAAAGELAEVFGSGALDADRRLRTHGFRRTAQIVIRRASVEQRAVLKSYAAGVNAAMSQWRSRPWEYWLLRSEPRPWSLEDSVLTAFALYLDLNDSTGVIELARTRLRAALPTQLFDFLHPVGTEWDAPIDGGIWRPAPIPGPEVFDLRRGAARAAALARPRSHAFHDAATASVGSNSWAVSGSLTASGGSLLANDMHLGLRVPNVWYRMRLIVERARDRTLDLVGVTIPGLPLLLAGSNGQVAWGLTNSYGDWSDLVAIQPDPHDARRYVSSTGSRAYAVRQEIIRVKGAESVRMQTRWTQWGPIIADDNGRPLVLQWSAHSPLATNLELINLEQARSVEQALDIANRAGGPVQNFIAADAQGQVGWSIMGRLPLRQGYDPRFVSSRQAGQGWVDWRAPSDYPRLIDPPTGRLWTANARVLDAKLWLDILGDGGYALGARAAQIRDALFALDAAKPADMMRVQLDERALFLARWRDLLLDLLRAQNLPEEKLYAEAREYVQQWSGHASVDDVGYRLVRTFRDQVRSQVFASLTASAGTPDLQPSTQFEGALWQLVTQRPAHLLDPHYPSWEHALLDAYRRCVDRLLADCDRLSSCTWGESNRLAMQHPMSRSVPLLRRWLDMPGEALPGDIHMPRIQGPAFGASHRMIVSPSREAEGILMTPGGASGHPLSPFYRSTHAAWAAGEPQPLLPGKSEHQLTLEPA